MPRRNVSIEGIDGWIEGLHKLADGVGEHQVAEWRYATERMYDRTQEYVHVITGDLKASGRYSVDEQGMQIEGTVAYGGGQVDYAIYEFNRGGNHSALQRGYLDNIDTFEQAIVDGVAAEIESWK